jgi:glycosyltransferase involved in cell wall biosynthesis
LNINAQDRLGVLNTGTEFRFQAGLTVFFPAFNDAESLPLLLERTFGTLQRVAADYEVVVVNDGSRDSTAEVLTELARIYSPHLRVITHAQNQGYGAALRSGFLAATKEYIFYTDGDGQYDPRDLERLLEAATPQCGLVNGYKLVRNDPWHRIALGWVYNRFARWLFRIRLRDIDCDFRLIRRSAFDPAALRSSGGTICLELVRNLELSGTTITELPVRHYPREHGRSQFFRIRSLAVTLMELFQVLMRLVVTPALFGPASSETPNPREPLSSRRVAFIFLCVTLLSVLAYSRALALPFISDDYVQIQLSRDFGPMSGWNALAHNALYRCRATSIILTYWIEQAFGTAPLYYNLASLLLHIINSLLVFALGFWRVVGWRVSALAACFFAVSQRHSEAVIWFAAVPELLVFLFSLTSFLFWILWLDSPRRSFYGGAVLAYLLALLSKESAVAVVPLCVLAVLCHPERPFRRLWAIAPLALIATGYFAMVFLARDTHLHFQDGTFSLQAPFLEVLARSMAGLLWIWGLVALLLFSTRILRPLPRLLPIGLAWMAVTLLPYSFLTYMTIVPSRHTYLASVGLSFIVASGFLAFRNHAAVLKRQWLIPMLASVIVAHQCGYLWTVLHRRYTFRAEPTEQLLKIARETKGTIYANCFPYSTVIAQYAIQIAIEGPSKPVFEVGPEAAKHPEARNFCNAIVEGVRY